MGRLLQRGVAVSTVITSLCVGFVTFVVSTPAEGTPVDALDSISCPSTNVCFAVGSYGAEGSVVTTTNGGATWTYQTLPSPVSYLSGISCPSTSDCFAVGAGVFGAGVVAGVVVATTDGGRTWFFQGLPDAPTGVPVSIACYSTSICYLAGTHFVDGTTDGGSVWNDTSLPAAAEDLASIACPTATKSTRPEATRSGNWLRERPRRGSAGWDPPRT